MIYFFLIFSFLNLIIIKFDRNYFFNLLSNFNFINSNIPFITHYFFKLLQFYSCSFKSLIIFKYFVYLKISSYLLNFKSNLRASLSFIYEFIFLKIIFLFQNNAINHFFNNYLQDYLYFYSNHQY